MPLPFREKVSSARPVLGTMLSEIACANVVRIMKAAGFDFVIADCEHGYFDFSQLANIVAVGNGIGLPVFIRIPDLGREFITKALDMGADGLLAPMINTPEDAGRLVEHAKYPPLGKRGLSTTRAHTNYDPPPLAEYLKTANHRTMLFAQIETRQAVENAAAIARTEGIAALLIGPNDLAADFDEPGILDSAAMLEAVERVVEASRGAGKSCGMLASDNDYLLRCREKGMNIFGCGSEVGLMLKAAKSTVRELAALQKTL